MSAVGTSNGLTSYDETQVTSSWTGSGASSTGALVIGGRDPRHLDRSLGDADGLDSGVSTTPEANPQAPWWMTRTAKPRSSVSLAPCSTPSRTPSCW